MATQSEILDLLPAPQRLALTYASGRTRAAHLGLFALDAKLAMILRKRREAVLVQVRLAWWRDMLKTPVRDWPAGDGVLDTLRNWRTPAALVRLVDGWEELLHDDLTPRVIADFVDGRGQAFGALADEVGAARPQDAREAGRLWALADLAANLSDGEERDLVVQYGRGLPVAALLPASLRPVAVLAGLAHAALENGGAKLLSGPKSTFTALRIGFTGR